MKKRAVVGDLQQNKLLYVFLFGINILLLPKAVMAQATDKIVLSEPMVLESKNNNVLQENSLDSMTATGFLQTSTVQVETEVKQPIITASQSKEEQKPLVSSTRKTIKKQMGTVGRFLSKLKPTLNDSNATEAAETVNVVVKNAPKILQDNIAAYLQPILVADVVSLSDALPRLRGLCKQAAEAVGYYSAQFKFSLKDDGQTLEVNVTAKEPVKISKLSVDLVGATGDEFKNVLSIYAIKEGDILNQGKYEALKTALVNRALDLGFFDAYWQRHDIAVDIAQHIAHIQLRYNVGTRYQLGVVTFRTTTPNTALPVKQDILDKLVPFKQGDSFDSALIETLNRNVSNTRYFSLVKVSTTIPKSLPEALLPDNLPNDIEDQEASILHNDAFTSDASEEDAFYGFSHDEVKLFADDVLNNTSDNAFDNAIARKAREFKQIPIDVMIDDAKPNRAEIGLGYATDAGIRLRTRYRRALLNPYGHNLETNFEVSKEKQAVDARYNLPYKDPLRDTLSFFIGAQREINNVDGLYLRSMTLGAERVKSPLNAWQRTQSLRYTFDTDEKRALLLGYAVSRLYGTGGFDEKSGFKQYYQVEVGSKSALSTTDMALLRAGWSALYSLDADTKHQLVGRIDVGSILSRDFADVPDQFKYFAGGDQSIRGFDYKSLAPKDDAGNYVGGQNLAVGSIEYNYRLWPKIRAAVFVDAGNAFDNNLSQPIEVGVGTGIRWMSPVGPLRVDVATGLNSQTGRAGSVRLTFFLGPAL